MLAILDDDGTVEVGDGSICLDNGVDCWCEFKDLAIVFLLVFGVEVCSSSIELDEIS